MMTTKRTYKDAEELQRWLRQLKVPNDAAAAASPLLWERGWFRESEAFINANVQQLEGCGLAPGLANSIYQRLVPWQQQQAANVPPTKTEMVSTTGKEPKKTKTMLDVAKADGCRLMSAEDLVELKKVVDKEDRLDVHEEPNSGHKYIGREVERRELHALLQPVLEAKTDHKKAKLVAEYATISGSGKTRWMFNAFKGWSEQVEGDELHARVVHWNFNGADNSNDCLVPARKATLPGEAIARLLFSRGLLECDPIMKWLNGGETELPNDRIPKLYVILDALFQSKFDQGKGLLVIHLDELSELRDARLKSEPKDEKGNVTDEGKGNVENWMKLFMSGVASLSDFTKKRFVVAVITHTSPSGPIMGPDSLSKVQYEPLKLYPFTLVQSWELINAARGRKGSESGEPEAYPPLGPAAQAKFEALVALAGGHPWLLLEGFKNSLIGAPEPPAGSQTTDSALMALVGDFRMKKLGVGPEEIPSKLARSFVEAVLKRSVVSDRENPFQPIFDAGVAWYLPLQGSHKRRGQVSAPFPHLLRLMTIAGGAYASVAQQLNPHFGQYEPTKAMEYVAALAVLLDERGDTELWKNFKVQHNMSFGTIENATEPFLTVWTSLTEATTDFGGKFKAEPPAKAPEDDVTPPAGSPVAGSPVDEPEQDAMEAIVGQVKMQKAGSSTTQDLREVMSFAFKVGLNVSGPVHAFFVSSRLAPKDENKIIAACRIAMSGVVKQEDAEASSLSKHGAANKRAKIADIRHVCQDLIDNYTVPDHCKFTYIGKKVQDGGPFKEMEDILPHGIFANW